MVQYLRSIALVTLCLAGWSATAQENGHEIGQENAQENSAKNPPEVSPEVSSVIRFAGLVQYVKGTAERVDSRTSRTALAFRTPVYEGERFQVAKDSALKLAARSGCTAAFYGEAQILAPNREKPWRTKAEALRWICPDGAGEKIDFRGVEIGIDPISGGEFFLNGSKLLVLRGTIVAEGHEGPLPIGRLLRYQAKKWVPVDPEPHPYEVWSFNESKRPPKESAPMEKPDRPITSRWILTPIGNRGLVRYGQGSLNQGDLDGGGARLQMHRRHGQGSLIFGITFSDLRDQSKQSSPNTPPVPGANSEIESFNVDTGWRFSHDRWWSPYFRVGMSVDKAKVQVNRPDIGYYSRNEYEFYSLTGAFGIDVIYSPRWLNWFGLYAAAEIQATQSLGRGARRTLDSNNWYTGPAPEESNEPWRLTLITGRIMLGAMLQF